MPLAAATTGVQAKSSDLNQIINLLTGVMTDQPVTLKGDNTRAPSLLTFDSVNAAQQVATKFNEAGVTKWILGKNIDNSFFVWDATAGRNVIQVQSSGGLTLMPTSGDVTIGGSARLVLGLAASKVIPGATSLSLRNNADSADNLILTDAGVATIRGGLTISAGGLSASGGLTVNTGDLNVSAGQVNSHGSFSAVGWYDRTGSANWQWYATGNVTRLWNGSQDVVVIDSAGGMTVSPQASRNVMTKVGLTDQPYAVSFGRATASFPTGRPVQNNFTLGTPFATSILSAACGLWPLGSWNGWYMLACDRDGANVRSQVNIVIDNSNGGVTQNFSVGWMAIGY